jgi:hypothetical protein
MVKAKLFLLHYRKCNQHSVAYPEFFSGVQQIQVRTEDRENEDLEAAANYSGILKAAVIWYKLFRFT